MIVKSKNNNVSFGFVGPQATQKLAARLLRRGEEVYVDVFQENMIPLGTAPQQADAQVSGFIKKFAADGKFRLAFKLLAGKLPELPGIRTRAETISEMENIFKKSKNAYRAGLVLNKKPEFKTKPLETIKTSITALGERLTKTQQDLVTTFINFVREGPLGLVPTPTNGTKIAKGIITGENPAKILAGLTINK